MRVIRIPLKVHFIVFRGDARQAIERIHLGTPPVLERSVLILANIRKPMEQ